MNELIIELTDITPKEFFGTQNNNIELIKTYFPKLKIVARGTKITAFGDDELLARNLINKRSYINSFLALVSKVL